MYKASKDWTSAWVRNYINTAKTIEKKIGTYHILVIPSCTWKYRKEKNERINKQNNNNNKKPTKAEKVPSNMYSNYEEKGEWNGLGCLGCTSRKKNGKWRISSFAQHNFIPVKAEIYLSQSNGFDHWLQLEEVIIYYHKDQLN